MLNPILEREIKAKMRTWKTSMIILAYLIFIGLILMPFMVQNIMGSQGSSRFDPTVVTSIYDTLAIIQLIILMSIIPLFTATSISSERERQTLDLLLCTDFSPWKIIFGKMGAALAFVLLIIFTSMPFIGVTFLYGGISFLDLGKLILYYMSVGFALSSIGIFASVYYKKNITAIVMSYVILGSMIILPIIFVSILSMVGINGGHLGIFKIFFEEYGYEMWAIVFGANPGFGLLSLLKADIVNVLKLSRTSITFFRHIPTWAISCGYFAIYSSIFLLLAKHKLSKIK